MHFSDFHNGYENLDRLIEYANSRSDVDAVVFSGDVLGPILSPKEISHAHKKLEEILKVASQNYGAHVTIEDAMKFAKKSKDKDLKNMF